MKMKDGKSSEVIDYNFAKGLFSNVRVGTMLGFDQPHGVDDFSTLKRAEGVKWRR